MYNGKNPTDSQCGQDIVVEFLLPVDSNRLYLDLGANDGVNGSSTFLLEKRGWRGMLVEPNVNLFPSLVSNRTNSYLLACAVGNKQEIMTLQTSDCHTLGSLITDKSSYQYKRLSAESGGDDKIRKLPVPVLTMEDILSSFYDIFNSSPDFLKIDVEGFEMQVVESLFKTNHRPLVIEVENNERKGDIADSLLSEGYSLQIVMDSFVEIWSRCNCDRDKLLNLMN